MLNLTRKLIGCVGLVFFASVCTTEATVFNTTTTTGFTSTGYFEHTVYDLNWDMGWYDDPNGWKPAIPLSDVINNGVAWINSGLLNLNNSNRLNHGTVYGLALPKILNANDIFVEVNGQNKNSDGVIPAYDFHVYIQGTSGHAGVNFIGTGAASIYSKLYAGSVYHIDDQGLIHRLDPFKTVGLRIHNNTVSAVVNGTTVLSKPFVGNLGKLVKIQLDFRGSTKVNYMNVYEAGQLKVTEDFNTNGQTTAKLHTRTGYLFTGNATGSTVTSGQYSMPDPSSYFVGHAPQTTSNYSATRKKNQEAASRKYKDSQNKNKQSNIVSPKDRGDPISIEQGAMTYHQTLMQLPGVGEDFTFGVNYNSVFEYGYTPLGHGFDHNYNIYLGFNAQDQELYYGDGNGFPVQFDSNGQDSWESDVVRAKVIQMPNHDMRMNFVDGREIFFRPIVLGNQEMIYRPYLIVDRNGNSQKLMWNNDDELTEVIDTTDRSILFTYNTNHKLTRVQEPGGRKVEFIYTLNNDIERIIVTHGADVKTTAFTYSTGFPLSQDHLNHNMLSIVDAKGQTYVTNTYNSNDEVTQQIYGGDTYSYNYSHDTQGAINAVAVTNGRGVSTTYTVNSQGLVTRKVRTISTGGVEITNASYTTDGRLNSYVFPLGNSEQYTYDSLGRVSQKRLIGGSLSQQWTYTYVGDTTTIASIAAPNGQLTTFQYDDVLNLISISQPNVSLGNVVQTLTTQFTYDNKGQLLSIIDPQAVSTSFVYGSDGQITSMTKGGDTVTFVPDDYGNISSFVDAEGNTFNFDYNNFNQLLQSTSAEGIVHQSTYDLTNNTTSSSTQIGSVAVDTNMTYDVLDRLISMTTEQSASTGQHYQWTYDPHNLIKNMTAPNGSVVSYTYDHNDNVVSQTITDGTTSKVYQYAYNINGELVSATAPNGSQSQRIRDGLGRVVEMRDALGTRTLITYNNQNLPTQVRIVNTAGVTLKKTQYEYNSIGWVLTQRVFTLQGTQRNQSAGQPINYTLSQATSYETHYTYNKRGQIKTVTDPKGFVTTMLYDTKGRLSQVRDPLSNTVTYTYDGRDLVIKKRITSATNGTSYDTRYLYDHDARLVKIMNNEGKYKTFVYNDLNQIVRIRDENGRRTDMTYDYQGSVLTQTQYLINSGGTTPLTTSYSYDIMNNLVSMTDAEGNTSHFVYDGFNRLTQEIYPDGKRNTFTYDLMDNVIQASDPNGTVVHNTYDQLSRLTARNITLAPGVGGVTQESYSYDALGRLVSGNDSMNQAISFNYDGLDRVVKERNNGKNLHYEYDANSNLSTVIYPSTKKLTREFDQLNRLTTMDWAAYGQTINLMDNDYDSLFLLESNFGNQAKTTYAYDNLMRVSSIDHYQSSHPMHSNAGQVIENLDYSYDKVSNVLGDGQRAYTLDSVYRLTDALYPPNQASAIKKEKIGYDKVGNRTQFESWVEKAHGNSAMNTNPTQVAVNPLVINQSLVSANGNSAKVTVCHNGQALEVNQTALAAHLAHGDNQGACAPVSSGSGTSSGTNGNGNGNNNPNTSNNGNGNTNGGSTSSGTTSSGTAQPAGPTYGGAGGTPGMLTFQGTTTYNTNNLNQYTSVTYPRNGSQTETVNFIYDDNGNLLQDDKREYQYDYRNRLIKATNLQNHEIITFKYDILNRRTQKTDRSKSWKWVYSFHDVVEEDWYMNASMTAGAIKVREFVYGNGMDDLVYMEQNKPLNYQDEQEEEGYTEIYTGGGFNTAVKRYFFQKDLAGSTKIVSDIQGKVIEMYAYDSFGRIYERNGISANYRPFQTSRVNHNRFFTNREYDTDLQLYYYRARWYSPALGRFMSRDPLGYSEGPNLYAYVGNNPTTFVDPWGLKAKDLILDKNGRDITNVFVDLFNKHRYPAMRLKKAYDNACSISDADCWAAGIFRNGFFAQQTEFGDSNLKMMRDPLLKKIKNDLYSIPYTEYGAQNMLSYYTKFNNEDLFVAVLGNILYAYRAYYAGYDLETIKYRALQVTVLKTWDWEVAKHNEIRDGDRKLYELGYNLAEITKGRDITKEDLLKVIKSFLSK